MRVKKLTDRQREVYDYLVEHVETKGYSPTCESMAKDFGWASPNAASEHLLALFRKGWIKKTPRGYYPVLDIDTCVE